MKKLLKCIMSIFISFSLITVTAYASDKEDIYYEVAKTEVCNYLSLRERVEGIKESHTYYISSESSDDVVIGGFEGEFTKTFLVYDEMDCVGAIIVTNDEGHYSSVFVNGNNDIKSEINKKINLTTISFSESGQFINSAAMVYGNTIGDTYSYLGVPHVENEYCPDISDTICWAASAASVVAYRQGISAPTAMQVYNNVRSICPPSLYPSGTSTYFEKMAYNYYGVTYNEFSSALTGTSMKSIIMSNRPILANIGYAGATNPFHAVVICGFGTSTNGSTISYIVNDPNYSSLIFTQSKPTSSTGFEYPSGYTHFGKVMSGLW